MFRPIRSSFTFLSTRMLNVSLSVALMLLTNAPFASFIGCPFLVFGGRLRLLRGRTPFSLGSKRMYEWPSWRGRERVRSESA